MSSLYIRDFFFKCKESLEHNNVIFALGPRLSGISSCMRLMRFTLNEEYEKVSYIDVKDAFIINKINSKEKKIEIVNNIIADIKNNSDILYLIDEAGYLVFPDKSIEKIANAYDDVESSKTKIVFSCGSSKALKAWAMKSFGDKAGYVYANKLSYEEWMSINNIIEDTKEVYERYLYEVRMFYSGYNDILGYLISCLEGASSANENAAVLNCENNIDDLDIKTLINILYLASKEPEKLLDDKYVPKMNRILQKAENYLLSLDNKILKRAYVFLHECEIIKLRSLNGNPEAASQLLASENSSFTNEEILNDFRVVIPYPMFYLDLLNLIYSNDKAVSEDERMEMLQNTAKKYYADDIASRYPPSNQTTKTK